MHSETKKASTVVAKIVSRADRATLESLSRDARLIEILQQLREASSVSVSPLYAFGVVYGYEVTANPLPLELSSKFFEIVSTGPASFALFDRELRDTFEEGYDMEKISLLEELEKYTVETLMTLATGLLSQTENRRILLSNILINKTKSSPSEFLLYDSANDKYYPSLTGLTRLHLLPFESVFVRIETLDEFYPVWRGFVDGIEDDKIVRL